jgi:hypothetical protein
LEVWNGRENIPSPRRWFYEIADCWLSPSATSNNLSLHRICTLARKHGANFVVLECALDQPAVRDDIEALDNHYGGAGTASAVQISFFSGDVSPIAIGDISSDALVAAATVINYAPPNTGYKHSWVFEAIVDPPHQTDGNGHRQQLLNNYICRDTIFTRAVRGRDFQVSGFYFCQQNALVHVCAHACLRMALNSIDGSRTLLSNSEINTQLGLAPPINGLSLGHVVDIINTRTGRAPVVADCSKISPSEYLSVLTSFVESGAIVLFVFTTANAIEHVVTAFGYTRNSDEWHPQAIPGYSGPATAPFYRSSSWVDHFVIHDDNFGTYYTLSSRAFEVDKSITAHWVIAIHPHQPELLPHYAETLASVVLKNAVLATSTHGHGNWFAYLSTQPWTFVTRPVLINRNVYQEHLRASEGHDQSRMTDQQIGLADTFPEWFWMVEFSLPALFTGNRSKLGEVLIRANVGGAKTDMELVSGFRLPGVFAVSSPTGGFDAHRIDLKAHSPFFVNRLHGNQW